jgi:hypothetical protein
VLAVGRGDQVVDEAAFGGRAPFGEAGELDASQAFRELDEVRPWQRRRVWTALRSRRLL